MRCFPPVARPGGPAGKVVALLLFGSFGDYNMRSIPDRGLATNGLCHIWCGNAVGKLTDYREKLTGFPEKLLTLQGKLPSFTKSGQFWIESGQLFSQIIQLRG